MWDTTKLFSFLLSFSHKYVIVISYSDIRREFRFGVFETRKPHQINLIFAWEEKVLAGTIPSAAFPGLIERLSRKANIPLKDCKFLFIVPEQYTVLRRLSLPIVSPKELASAVILNVKRKLPARLEEIRYSFFVTAKEAKKQEVVFYGILRSYIQQVVPPDWVARVLFCPRDLAMWTLVKNSGRFPEKTIFSLLYPAEDKYVLTLSDKNSNLLVKEISSLKQLDSELTLIVEYYKKAHRDLVEGDKIPLLCLLDESLSFPVEANLPLNKLLPFADSIAGIKDVGFLASAYGAVLAMVVQRLPMIEVRREERQTGKGPSFRLPVLAAVEAWFAGIPEEMFIYVVLGAVLVGGGYSFYHYQRYNAIRKEYNAVIATLPKDVFPRPGSVSQRDIDNKQRYFEREIKIFSSYLDHKKGVYRVLEVIKRRFGGSFWLKLPFRLKLDIRTGKIQLTLTGGVYLGDPEKEIKALEELTENLRKDLEGYFNDIDLLYYRREKDGKREYLAFSLRCV